MADKTEHNTPTKSDHNQHTGNQKTHGADNSDLSQEKRSLEDIMQEMNDMGSKPEVQGTLIPSYCQKIKTHCQLLVTYLSNFSISNCNLEDTDKHDNFFDYTKSDIHDMYKRTKKLLGIASREQLSDPSLLQDLQEGLHELSKDAQKLYKFVIDNLKKLAVKLGIREENMLEKGMGLLKGAAHAIDTNSSLVNDTKNRFKNLVKSQKSVSSKDKNTQAKNNNHRGRS